MSYIDKNKERLEQEGLKKLEEIYKVFKEKIDNDYKSKIDELKSKYDLLVEEFAKRLS
ncbi:hypothetical protein Calag_0029 [Caldisphaera lagunensis DSM 15908]|uniref:Uncharacterized protein n=1 Tax=Caldisphaera lagunensis (strain DSM 15908 / JCM 11604 / ANMR 0165 / IC-154) TaxID=1056495 RepID=L0A9K7_CALLD|nr:hypothetical protein [Caldisphaera lagunensis]AFZ69822.1 hypothetical protein Calag_0029 [Caldisphaera lagunensis DSM 15908]